MLTNTLHSYDQYCANLLGREQRDLGVSSDRAIERLESVYGNSEDARRYFDAGFRGDDCPVCTGPVR
jgi:hypothetical protein